ncbi:MAG: dihydrofolate reductase [Haliscomenobacteraceae bacterium CHB4]|nr:IS1595 family transposase ISCac2 [Saprospiraceae bacterium]MCE7926506.1 dihydrofolate reductase [Haliscomenobacteraceae bacterium CHB4]
MQPRKLTLYIAASLDGYIAKPDGDIGWLSSVEAPPEDYGYAAFVKTVDTVIMGRKTYEKVLSFGIPWPHKGRKCYVLSKTKTGNDENVEFFNGDPGDLLAHIRQTPGLNIYCDGGADVVHELAQKDLIDQYVVSIIPVLLGEGIALFKPGRPEQNMRLTRCETFPTGLVQLHYERIKG